MAMRLYTRDEFEEELKKHGLQKTEFVTDTGCIWKTSDDKFIAVPNVYDDYEKIPDCVLDELLKCLGQLYDTEFGN